MIIAFLNLQDFKTSIASQMKKELFLSVNNLQQQIDALTENLHSPNIDSLMDSLDKDLEKIDKKKVNLFKFIDDNKTEIAPNYKDNIANQINKTRTSLQCLRETVERRRSQSYSLNAPVDIPLLLQPQNLFLQNHKRKAGQQTLDSYFAKKPKLSDSSDHTSAPRTGPGKK